MTLAALLALALVAYLPGAVIFRVPLLDPRSRAGLPAEERVFWAIVLSVGFSCMLVLALAAGGWYRFERLLWLNGGLSAAAMLVWRGRLRFGAAAARPTAAALIPAALVAGCLWLYGPPAEYVMGGKDPGSYMNQGIQVAQRGALVTEDPVVSAIPREFVDLLIPPHHVPSYYGSRFMGFFVLDPAAGTVLGQFPHLFPASIALGYGIHGLTGARQVTLAWTLLALVAVYLAGARLFGRAAAAAGAGLLALNVIEVWFSRYPNAEVVAQALLFAAMLAWSRAQVDAMPFFGPVAASLAGMLLFLRFDMIIALGGFVGAAALGRLAGLAPVTGFFPVLALWLAAAALYLFGLMQPYMALPIVFIANLPWWQMALLAAAALAAAALLAGAARLPAARRLVPWLPSVVIAAAVAAAGYAYFFRQAAGRIAEHDAMALRSFAWYVTPAGLAAGLVGFVAAARRFLTRDPVLLLTLSLYAGFFFYKIRIVPEHFWMTRRFLPVILPAALLLVGHAALGRWRASWTRTDLVRAAAGAVLIGALAAAFWRQSAPVARHVEYAGLIPRLEKLASGFGDRDLVLVESREASDVHVLALPLAYIYARNVLVLPNRRPDPAQFGPFLDWARQTYGDVYFIGGGGTDLLTRDIAVRAVDTHVFQIPEWESSRNALPAGPRRKEFDFSVYKFVSAEEAPAADAVVLDVGINDDLNVVRFHAKERHQNGTTFRWSRDVSYISLQGIAAGSRTLTLVLDDGGRPAQVPRALVEVSMDDRVLGRVEVGRDFKPYSFAIPPEVASGAAARDTPARLKLATPTWTPREVLPVSDDRDLGVMVDRVEVR